MRKLTIGLTLASTLLFQAACFAGTERGGGNLLEAAFATAINQMEVEVGKLGERAKSKLKFSIDQYVNASSGINVECAYLKEDIDYLNSRKRLAFVKNPGGSDDKIIYLNCYNQSSDELILTSDWNDVLLGITQKGKMGTNAKVLVIHEVFRAGGLEIKEGDYKLSSSLKLAQAENEIVIKEQVREMILGTNERCRIHVFQTRSCAGYSSRYDGLGVNVYARSSQESSKELEFAHKCQIQNGAMGIRPSNLEGLIMELNTENDLSNGALTALAKSSCYDNR
jgi:hypothetical protein